MLLAAVGPRMTQVAAEVADGLIVHGFTTERDLREATWPLIDAGLSASGRGRDRFTVSHPGLLATGGTGAAMEAAGSMNGRPLRTMDLDNHLSLAGAALSQADTPGSTRITRMRTGAQPH